MAIHGSGINEDDSCSRYNDGSSEEERSKEEKVRREPGFATSQDGRNEEIAKKRNESHARDEVHLPPNPEDIDTEKDIISENEEVFGGANEEREC
jgi:hypothetical protein